MGAIQHTGRYDNVYIARARGSDKAEGSVVV